MSSFFYCLPLVLILAIILKASRGWADDVFDCGDSLMIRIQSRHAVITLDDIDRIEFNSGRGPHVVVFLRVPCALGNKIMFTDANMKQRWFGRATISPTIAELISRVEMHHDAQTVLRRSGRKPLP